MDNGPFAFVFGIIVGAIICISSYFGSDVSKKVKYVTHIEIVKKSYKLGWKNGGISVVDYAGTKDYNLFTLDSLYQRDYEAFNKTLK